jgi:hypothetical protein
MSKLARSWELAKASLSVLKADKELLLFPILSTIATLLLAASFLVPVVKLRMAVGHDVEPSPTFYVWMGLFYLAASFVTLFFNTALVGCALMRMSGRNPTLGDGLRIAAERAGPIFGYAVISATVGLVLRAISERLGFVGRLVTGFIGLGWTVATFLVVPVLVTRNIGPLDAVKESAGLLRRSWGENLAGNAGIGLVGGLVTAAVAVVGFLLGTALLQGPLPMLGALLIGATIVALGVVAMVVAALTGIYSAALYRFAVDGQAPPGFDAAALRSAFHQK